MLPEVLTLAALVALLSLAWYVAAANLQRRRSRRILQCLSRAFAGHGKLCGVRWCSPSGLLAQLHLNDHSPFASAELSITLAPWQSPWAWLQWKRQRRLEQVVFEAELEEKPAFALEVERLHWEGRSRRELPAPEGLQACSTLIITTQREWEPEVSIAMRSLGSHPERELLGVTYRRGAPHFSATLSLAAITNGAHTHSGLFAMLAELAGGASASHAE